MDVVFNRPTLLKVKRIKYIFNGHTHCVVCRHALSVDVTVTVRQHFGQKLYLDKRWQSRMEMDCHCLTGFTFKMVISHQTLREEKVTYVALIIMSDVTVSLSC